MTALQKNRMSIKGSNCRIPGFIILFMLIFLFVLLISPAAILSYPDKDPYLREPFIFPLNGNIIVGFREEYFDIDKQLYYRHTGIDISGSQGDRVLASGNGIVAYTGFSPTGGRTVVIRHNDNIRTTYLNLQSIYVSQGDTVKQGDIIASIGALDDPSCSHCHLHFGIIYINKYLDPLQVIGIDYSSISRFLRLVYVPGDFKIY